METTKKFDFTDWVLLVITVYALIACIALAVAMYQGKAVVDGCSKTFLGMLIGVTLGFILFSVKVFRK